MVVAIFGSKGLSKWIPTVRTARGMSAHAVMRLLTYATTTLPRVAASKYFAQDDPNWVRLGVSQPRLLALITEVARRDRRVAATISAGLYENVLVFLFRLTDVDPNNLPPLRPGPLLVAPEEPADLPAPVDESDLRMALERLGWRAGTL